MKRMIALLLAALMLLSLTACGVKDKSADSEAIKTESNSKPSIPERKYDESDPTALLDEITKDFEATLSNLAQQQTETFTNVGTTFEDYQKNKGLIDEWIELAMNESDALFERTRDHSIAYFKLIAAHPDHKYKEYCDDALDEFYDVCEDVMDDYYDDLYDDAMEELYEQYYDGIIEDAYHDLEYRVWDEASSECYKVWSEASTAVYRKWSDESAYLYQLWNELVKAFCWNNNFKVDEIVSAFEKEKAEKDAEIAEEESKVYTDLEVLYAINSDGDAEVIGFYGEGNLATIDLEYEGEDVVCIADSAFENCLSLEKVILWADIETIGDAAFKGCTALTEFSIPTETEFIGNHAFEGCTNLDDLLIWGDPDIGEYAFSGCTSLEEISIGSDTKNIGAHAFENCTGITSLFIWGADIIGDYAFAGCTSIEEVSIPRKVLSIGNHAFDGCSELVSVMVWGDDTAIGTDAFANCPKLTDAPASRGTVLEGTNEDHDEEKNQDSQTSDVLRPEFKEAMDSYEAFYTEYCEFMKEYKEDQTDVTLLTKYVDMLDKAEEMDKAFKKWDEEELNSEESVYYLEVNNRVMKMLAEVI